MNLYALALAWLLYAALHSALAAHGTKAWVSTRRPQAQRYYRVAYNAIAALTLLPVAWMTYAIDGTWLWQWRGFGAWLANGAALGACVGFAASARYYDMAEFLGLRQLRTPGAIDRGGFVISPFHRFVRHPWYCFGLVLIWSRDMNAPLLLSAIAVTLYFIVGSRLEEKKLLATYGEPYRRYMERVPGLLPLPWKFLPRKSGAE